MEIEEDKGEEGWKGRTEARRRREAHRLVHHPRTQKHRINSCIFLPTVSPYSRNYFRSSVCGFRHRARNSHSTCCPLCWIEFREVSGILSSKKFVKNVVLSDCRGITERKMIRSNSLEYTEEPRSPKFQSFFRFSMKVFFLSTEELEKSEKLFRVVKVLVFR